MDLLEDTTVLCIYRAYWVQASIDQYDISRIDIPISFLISNATGGSSEETLIDQTVAISRTGWTNAWQKFTPTKTGALGSIYVQLSNSGASNYNLAISIYTVDNDNNSANPNDKFSGTPFDFK